MNYQSRARFLGLPLVHVTTGTLVDGVYRRGIAKGWVAIGDISFGVLLSFGGVSVGGVSVGGLATGVLSVGGLALGIGSIGGVGFGVLAVGGAAFGWSAALGGLAVARDFATGGAAVALHANDALATEYFAAQPFFRAATWLMDYSIALVFIPVLIGLVARIRQKSRPTPLHPPT